MIDGSRHDGSAGVSIEEEDWTIRPLRELALLDLIRKEVSGTGRLLEIGCRDGQRLRQLAAGTDDLIGLDAYPPTGAPAFVRRADARLFDWASIVPRAASVLFVDSLEHFERVDAEQLLEQALRHASRVVVVFCPYGDQCPGNPLMPGMAHLSAWYPEDFVVRGFDSVRWLRNYHMPGVDGNPISVPADAILAVWRAGSRARASPLHEAGVRRSARSSLPPLSREKERSSQDAAEGTRPESAS